MPLNSEHQPQWSQLRCFQNVQFPSFSFLNKSSPQPFLACLSYLADFEEWTLGVPLCHLSDPFSITKWPCGWSEAWLMLAKSIVLFFNPSSQWHKALHIILLSTNWFKMGQLGARRCPMGLLVKVSSLLTEFQRAFLFHPKLVLELLQHLYISLMK